MKELTQIELTTLNTYRQVFNNITRELGTVAIMQKDLDDRRKKAESALDENRTGYGEYINSLQQKYGSGQLDLDRGLFIPATPTEANDSVPSEPNSNPVTEKRKPRSTKKES